MIRYLLTRPNKQSFPSHKFLSGIWPYAKEVAPGAGGAVAHQGGEEAMTEEALVLRACSLTYNSARFEESPFCVWIGTHEWLTPVVVRPTICLSPSCARRSDDTEALLRTSVWHTDAFWQSPMEAPFPSGGPPGTRSPRLDRPPTRSAESADRPDLRPDVIR